MNSSYVSVVESLQLSHCFFEFLTLEHPNNNVHNIRLCRQLIISGSLSHKQLMDHGAADKVSRLCLHHVQCQATLARHNCRAISNSTYCMPGRGVVRGCMLQASLAQHVLPESTGACGVQKWPPQATAATVSVHNMVLADR